jgi:hypothetical protein
MANDIRLARALAAANQAAPVVQPSLLLSVVRAVLDASDTYVYERETACVERESGADRPLCHEKALTAIENGDLVWSDEDRWFHRVDATQQTGRRLHLFCQGDLVMPFDLDEVRTILVADSVSAAEEWNRARPAEAVGPWVSPLVPLTPHAVEFVDGDADERGVA